MKGSTRRLPAAPDLIDGVLGTGTTASRCAADVDIVRATAVPDRGDQRCAIVRREELPRPASVVDAHAQLEKRGVPGAAGEHGEVAVERMLTAR